MIGLDLYIAFVVATAVLMLIPGPNVALIVANSIAHGTRYGLLTVAGTSAGVVIQLVVAGVGANAALEFLAAGFEWLRWCGVAYLVWAGVVAWRAPVTDLAAVGAEAGSARAIFVRGLTVCLVNPKTLLFIGAFLPQFVVPGPDMGRQLLLLAVTFLTIAIVLDGTWAVLAGRLRGMLILHARLRNRVTGGLLVGAGVGLALARRP